MSPPQDPGGLVVDSWLTPGRHMVASWLIHGLSGVVLFFSGTFCGQNQAGKYETSTGKQ